MEASVNEADPSEVTAIVRMPAGRSGERRSSISKDMEGMQVGW
jgi:hypothetical protein